MEDLEIISLLFRREETGLTELREKYGRLCHSIAKRILPDDRDVEESISDGYLRVWNVIPPERPDHRRRLIQMKFPSWLSTSRDSRSAYIPLSRGSTTC